MTTLSSVGLPPVAVGTGQSGSTGSLEFRLNRYQTQLADWCHCPDGKSPDGQKKIADLQQKADSIKEQIRQVETRRSDQRVSASSALTASALSPDVGRSPMRSALDVYA